MALLVSWVAYPLLLSGLGLGCGLLLERIAGRSLPGPLLLPAGFAVVLVAASFTTMRSETASLTAPLVVALAIAGAGLGLPLRRRLDWWAAGAALAVFAVYAAPIVLSGAATFAGYISLDDTATWLALADNAMTHGRSVAGLAPSSYSVVLNDDLGSGYPLGAVLPLGIGHELVGQDAAWLFQPYLAFLAALLGLSIYGLVSPLLRSRPSRALVVFVGTQPALLYGYAFWSGIKELTVAYLIALSSAAAAAAATRPWAVRTVVPLAFAAAALLAVDSLLGVVWLAGLAVGTAAFGATHVARRTGAAVAVLVGCVLILAIPSLATARRFVSIADRSDAGNGALGNLLHPLSRLQLLGVWPSGDFRGRPHTMTATYVLLCLVALAATFALFEAARRRAWGLPLYALVAIGGCALVLVFDRLGHGSPWLDGKALASASPAPVVAAVAGAASLLERGRRVEAIVAAAAITAGVLWSNGLAYGNVWLAPRSQLSALEAIGERFAGEGPALMTEYQPYGVRHFLRSLDPEGASERRARPVALRTGGLLDKGQYADLDAFDLAAVLVYRTLVLRTSPLESRPPSVYAPVSAGPWYEVWQRPRRPARILEHLSLGQGLQPVAIPSCTDVFRLAAEAARAGGTVVAAERPPAQVADLSQSTRPSSWPAGPAGTVVPGNAGSLSSVFTAPIAGRYGFWLGGSFRDRVRVLVDGVLIGSARDQLESTAQATPLGSIELRKGRHRFELRYDGRGLRPGSRGAPFFLGPLEIGAPATAARLTRVAPAGAGSLCGRSLDWIEAVAP